MTADGLRLMALPDLMATWEATRRLIIKYKGEEGAEDLLSMARATHQAADQELKRREKKVFN